MSTIFILHLNKILWAFVYTCCIIVVDLLVLSPVDKFPQAGDRVGANQSVATKSPAVHHSDVQWRVKQLIFWQILTGKKSTRSEVSIE